MKVSKEAQKSVNYLVKQFEMKKSADEYRRAAVSKTGVINTNTLYKYKLTDDIFKKVTTVPEGKNHGLVLHLDWSGSMQYGLLDTLQTMNLIWFCQHKFHSVYAFQSSSITMVETNMEIQFITKQSLQKKMTWVF